MTTAEVQIVDGVDREYVDDALRITYDAFAKKFRIGFRGADDFVRLFRDSVDPENCLFAIVDGELSGVLAFQMTGHEFYQLNLRTAFEKFSPFRAGLVIFNLILLAFEDALGADEFHIDLVAVVPSSRGMGIGTALMLKAEENAESTGKHTMSLGVHRRERRRYSAVRTTGLQDHSNMAGVPRAARIQLDRGATHGEADRRQYALKLRNQARSRQ